MTQAKLAQALTELRAKNACAAFDTLLAAWRELRCPELAEACVALSERAKDAKLEGKTENDRMMAWATAFRERSALGLAPLLASFEAMLRTAQPRFVFPRADALATVEDDPRLSAVMLNAIRIIEGGSRWEKILRRYLRSLEASRDPRTIAALEEHLKGLSPGDRLTDFTIEQGTKILAKLTKRFAAKGIPALPTELQPALAEVREAIARYDGPLVLTISTTAAPNKKMGDASSLLADVYATPDDDALREVLADALIAENDPRGELILLQLRRARGETDQLARERALLKEHGKALLGPLAAVVSQTEATFARGFLEICVATTKNQAEAELHFQYREWATVRSIVFRGPARITPAMSSLRRAGPLDDLAIKELSKTGHRTLERLSISPAEILAKEDSPIARAFSDAEFPALRELVFEIGQVMRFRGRVIELGPDAFRRLEKARWFPKLELLGVPSSDRDVRTWLRWLDGGGATITRLELVTSDALLAFSRTERGLTLAVRPAKTRILTLPSITSALSTIGDHRILEVTLEPGTTRYPPEQHAEVKRQLARLKGARVVVPF